MVKFKYVLIGNSAAAISAAESIRSIDKEGSLAIVGAEDSLPYSPALTTYYISNTIAKENIFFKSKDFYKKNKIKAFLGKPAVGIDRKKKTVELEDGNKLSYEKLLISTGGLPQKPDLKGVDLEGVFTLRTIEDAEKIKKRAAKAKSAVVLGGGLVGLRSAYALHQIGLKVTIVVGSPQILSQNIDREAAKIMENWLKEKRFNLLTSSRVVSIEGKSEVKEVILDGGKKIVADIVIIGKGVKSNTVLAEGCRIKTDRGIVVDDNMKTSDSNIYAAGDVAQAHDKLLDKKVVNAIWPVATEQGRVAGINMAGGEEKYGGSFAMNSVDFYGLSALSIGISCPPAKENYEVIATEDSAKHLYRKLVFKKDVLVGAILIGDIERAGILTGLIDEGVKVTSFKNSLAKNKFGFMVMPKPLREKKIAGTK
ncbi:MAG: NAD(P)/FAD-dependent oxidoreductase [Actinobacteria bacterium]|nr:MAG: NAD(P)/FAD-dependent oxidoreductase [Actinomycetota bacterium]